jgi:hypothetical protein
VACSVGNRTAVRPASDMGRRRRHQELPVLLRRQHRSRSSASGLLPSRQESVEDDSALGGRRRTARLGPRFQDTRGTSGVVAMPRASSTAGQVRLNGG